MSDLQQQKLLDKRKKVHDARVLRQFSHGNLCICRSPRCLMRSVQRYWKRKTAGGGLGAPLKHSTADGVPDRCAFFSTVPVAWGAQALSGSGEPQAPDQRNAPRKQLARLNPPHVIYDRQVKHGKLEAELSSGIVIKRLLRYIACVSFTLCAGHGASE